MTSHIETLLDKEVSVFRHLRLLFPSILFLKDVTLQQILDEDDVLQECKAQNRRLVDFLTKPENMEELVNLVTKEPVDDVDEKKRYK
jgi:serine/threonine-protein phosphatase 6 regulatory subunit 3